MIDYGTIAEHYSEKHETDPGFSKGTGLLKHVPEIATLCKQLNVETILDYGCGKGIFWANKSLYKPILKPYAVHKLQVHLYDPFIPKFAGPIPSKRFDMVICTDVLEHVMLEEVVDTIDKLILYTRKVLFLDIDTVPAKKKFKDGTNLHITVKPREWWEELINERLKKINVKYNTSISVIRRYGELEYA